MIGSTMLDSPLTTQTIDPKVKATASHQLTSIRNPGFNFVSSRFTLPLISLATALGTPCPDSASSSAASFVRRLRFAADNLTPSAAHLTLACRWAYRPFRARREFHSAAGAVEGVLSRSENRIRVGVKNLLSVRCEWTATLDSLEVVLGPPPPPLLLLLLPEAMMTSESNAEGRSLESEDSSLPK